MALFVYLGVLCLSLAIVVFLAAFTLSRAESGKMAWFTAMLASLFIYLLGSMLGTLATTVDGAFNGTRVEYLGAGFLGPVTFLFIADYCKVTVRNSFKAIMLTISLILIILLWTTPYHGLTYSAMEFNETGFSGLNITSGPLYSYSHIYGLLCILASGAIIVWRCFVWGAKNRRPLILLLFTALIPAIVNVAYAMNITPLSESGVQATPVMLSAACIFLWFNIVKLNMFDILSEALKVALRSTKEAFILIGPDNNFLHANETAGEIFPEMNSLKKGSQISAVKNWPFERLGGDAVSARVNFDMHGERYYSASIDEIIGAGSKLLGHIILIQNITEVVLSAKKAEQASQAKSNFLATMSHEIRTPMNAIIGMAQIQMQTEDLPQEYALAMNRIYNSGNTLLGIINDILDMSKIETGKMELNPVSYDTPSLIHDVAQINAVRIGSKPLKFLLDIDENLPSRLIGDELRLRQILNNLISNAIKYTEEGHVKLSVGHFAQDDDVMLRFIVEDTGHGMKTEDMEKLYSVYLRFNSELSSAIEGTGIGLSITKSLVDLMGGTIEANSEYGKGSTFTVTVKQTAAEHCQAIGKDLADQLSNFSFSGDRTLEQLQIDYTPMPHGRVLIVDDVEINLIVAEGMLMPYELNIELADSGFEAIDKVESGGEYDIIFMDHLMPQMDGIETTRKLRALGYGGAIVALTANALVGNAEMFIQNGFDDFISKPIDVRQMNMILNKFI